MDEFPPEFRISRCEPRLLYANIQTLTEMVDLGTTMDGTRVVAKSIEDRRYEVQNGSGDLFVFRFEGQKGTLQEPVVWSAGHVPYDGMATILIEMALRVATEEAASDGVVLP